MSSENPDGDHDGAGPASPDANGQAAILLVESLIHGLIARRVITLADAIEIVDTAAEAEADVWCGAADLTPDVHRPAGILATIGDSLRLDIPER